MNTTNTAIALLCALLAATPAVADDEKKLESEAQKENACITIRPRMYLQAVGDEFVYVESGSDNFLMTLVRRCPGLDRGFNIRFQGKRRRVCSNNRAALEYFDQNIEMPACRIRVIDRVENWQDAQALMIEKQQAREKSKKERERKD